MSEINHIFQGWSHNRTCERCGLTENEVVAMGGQFRPCFPVQNVKFIDMATAMDMYVDPAREWPIKPDTSLKKMLGGKA